MFAREEEEDGNYWQKPENKTGGGEGGMCNVSHPIPRMSLNSGGVTPTLFFSTGVGSQIAHVLCID